MFKVFKTHIRAFAACGLALSLLLTGVAAASAASIGAYTTKGAWSFVSAPNLHPPKLSTNGPTAKKGLAPGYFLVSNFPSVGGPVKMVGEGGPLILDSHLNPVWVGPSIGTNDVAANLKEQTFEGKPALSWWQGTITATGITTSGEDVVVNQQYKTVATLKGADGWIISQHDMDISGDAAWVTAYKDVPMNLTPYGGPANGTLYDAAVQKYDLATGQLLYSWDALAHIPLSDSYQPASSAGPWDAYHENSIQLVSGNRFLVSMRQEWAAYLVSDVTSNIEWTLGGKDSTFTFGKGAQFEWQHDVQLHGDEVSLFDDHCCEITGPDKFANPTGPSRALVLTLNTTKHTATETTSITLGPKFDAAFLGSTQLLPNGNVLVSWGSTSYFSEYSKTGKLLLEVTWPGAGSAHVTNETYRVYLENWTGTPGFPPSGAVRVSKGKATVYASWDGATQVTAWRVLGGTNPDHLPAVVRKVSKTGFETTISLSKTYATYKVQALNSKGKIIGTSKAFSAPKSSGGSGGNTPGFY